jgi:hypothetical protein
MTRSEIKQIHRALELLRQLVPNDERSAADNLSPKSCPVTCFAKRYLISEPTSDVTSTELWRFFAEVAASGQVRLLAKAEFLRRLPAVMEGLFGSLKSHNIVRAGHRLRGFRGVGIRVDPVEGSSRGRGGLHPSQIGCAGDVSSFAGLRE